MVDWEVLKVGDRLWFTSSGSAAEPTGWRTVSRVGWKYVYLTGGKYQLQVERKTGKHFAPGEFTLEGDRDATEH